MTGLTVESLRGELEEGKRHSKSVVQQQITQELIEKLHKSDINNLEILRNAKERDLKDCGLSPGAIIILRPYLEQGSDDTSGRLEQAIKNLDEKVDRLSEKVESVYLAFNQLMLNKINEYVNAPSTQSLHKNTFRQNVALFYGLGSLPKEGKARCLVTEVDVHVSDLQAGHIVPRAMRHAAEADINLADVDDPRNGILWCSPLEAAWSQHLFMFINPSPDCFKLTVLDETFLSKRIQDYPVKNNKHELKNTTKEALGPLTWGDLHMRAVQFPDTSRPFKRCLSHMAKMFLFKAVASKWQLPDEVKALTLASPQVDYVSEDAKDSYVLAWLRGTSGDQCVSDVGRHGDQDT